MRLLTTLPWQDPLETAYAASLEQDTLAFLFSGLQSFASGHYSLLAMLPKEEIKGDHFDTLAPKLCNDTTAFDSAWFGYLGYELKHDIESYNKAKNSKVHFPRLWFVQYHLILIFDHHRNQIDVWGDDTVSLDDIPKQKKIPEQDIQINQLSSNMDKEAYLHKVNQIREALFAGDIYQANLTRKFFGTIDQEIANFAIFAKLCKASPAPFSAFLKCDDYCVISSSPECFLNISPEGDVTTRPIKGSAARHSDSGSNFKARLQLQNSQKDRAENLMIVDLSRNDLARHCKPGSVKTTDLFEIESYATVNHMVSTIRGTKRQDASTLDVIKGCFPPGSMTGTPKIKAIEWCNKLEELERGVYSGALGWFGGDGSANLSVVIRTIVMHGNSFEFQVGGAIVIDSDPISELEETFIKARGISAALGLDMELLRNAS